MGYTGALGMADAVEDGLISLDVALGWHLSVNHYPPLPRNMLPALIRMAKETIDRANVGEWDYVIVFEEYDGRSLTVSEIAEALNLWAYIENEEDY